MPHQQKHDWGWRPHVIERRRALKAPEEEDLLDAQPAIYKDEGCSFASKCLECPFPDCALDLAVRGSSTPRIVANLIAQVWRQPGADRAQLFKAAQVCLYADRPKTEKALGPELLEEINAYGCTEGGGGVSRCG